MKIAVLVYGRLNNCDKHYNNIIEKLGNHEVIDFFLSSDNSSESLLKEFVRLYKPILYNNNPIYYGYTLDKYPGLRPETNIHNMICHFYNKNRVFSLMEEFIQKTNIKYDCVVSLRIDCVFQNYFDFNSLKNNTLYVPDGFDYINDALNDQIAYGNEEVMKKYNCINIIDLLEKKLSIPHPESLNYANVLFHKLDIKRVDLKYYLDK